MKRKKLNSSNRHQGGKKDYRIPVLLAAGLLVCLVNLLSYFAPLETDRQGMPTTVNKLPANQPLTNELRPLFYLPISINRANNLMLEAIPGIGPQLSSRITQLRDNRGGRIESMEELREVDGIGDKKLAEIKKYCAL